MRADDLLTATPLWWQSTYMRQPPSHLRPLSFADRSRLGSNSPSPGLFSSLKRRKSKQDLLEGTHTKAADVLQQATRRFLAKKRAREAKQKAEEEEALSAALALVAELAAEEENNKQKQYEELKEKEFQQLTKQADSEKAEEAATSSAEEAANSASSPTATPDALVAVSNTVFALWTIVTAVLRTWVAFIVVCICSLRT